MFVLPDHQMHLEAAPLPRDVDARQVEEPIANGAQCRPPVVGAVYGRCSMTEGHS